MNLSLEDLICMAYTYIEFNKSYRAYANNKHNRSESEEVIKHNWENVIAAYNTVSEYMADSAIKQAQDLVMGEF